MKKIIGIISLFATVLGAIVIVLSFTLIDNYILFYLGGGAMLVGIIGALCTGTEIKEVLLRILDHI